MGGGEGAWRQGRTRHTPEREVTSQPPSSSTLGYYSALQPGMCWCGHGRDSVGPIHHPPALPQHTPTPPGENPGSPCPTRHPNPPYTQLWSVTSHPPSSSRHLARVWSCLALCARPSKLVPVTKDPLSHSNFGMGPPPPLCWPHRLDPTRPCTLFQAWTHRPHPHSGQGAVRFCLAAYRVGNLRRSSLFMLLYARQRAARPPPSRPLFLSHVPASSRRSDVMSLHQHGSGLPSELSPPSYRETCTGTSFVAPLGV